MYFCTMRIAPISITIIGINLLVFATMCVFEGSIFLNNEELFYHFGGLNRSLVIEDAEYVRLLSAVFIHGGLLHLAFNMYALWVLGRFMEPMLSSLPFLFAYLVLGMSGSVGSIVWQDSLNVSVGASGAIFGLIGLLTSLMALGKTFYLSQRKKLLKNLLFVIGLNLIIGFSIPGIDNAGHLGGLVGGLFAGILPGLMLTPAAGQKRFKKWLVFSLLGVLILNSSVLLFLIAKHF